MSVRCRLCRHEIHDADVRVCCRCGWVMDKWCAENHRPWCPRLGAESWLGAVEI
ncbi:hypothetical protein [Halogranum amylolyticum]|uniref:hypothetical protein n=1 Tax=Halogranum amylolyticum TaxID=660520 RepID=UPI00147ABA01|nr:hypothetical protein [Halogranum amylolyticum]